VTVPCFHVSGWFDFFTRGMFINFLGMREKGGSQLAREGQHILMGPWGHGEIASSYGDIHFGMLADARGAQLHEQNMAFFNKYLRGMDNSLPVVRYFVMGSNIWKESETWPPSDAQWQRFFLHSKGRANTSVGDGLLSRDEPGPEPEDNFIYNPHLPVPTTGCRGHAANGFLPGPKDQSYIERRDDILCYTTSILKEDIEVTGPLELHLFASTSVRDTDFTAKLCDVHPDGRSYNVAGGIIRARYRKSYFEPELLTPGEVNEYVINMGNSSQLFRKGHRIRINLTSSNFPEFDRNMNTGNPVGEDARGIPAMQSIYHESKYPSYITLPVIPL
ncbi:CocE/NonD family hydrolase, partial [Thermodesulfobacteriota bacterium]